MKKILITLASGLALSGCASQGDYDAYYEAVQATEATRAAERRAAEVAYLQAIERVKDSPIAVVAIALSRNNTYATTRPQVEIQSPDSFADTVTAMTPLLQTGLTWGLGAWAVGSIVDGMGDSFAVKGRSSLSYTGDTITTEIPTGSYNTTTEIP